jgi:RNA polymerase sigma-70 factor (ECF subfamily)
MTGASLGDLFVEQIPRLRRYARALVRDTEQADDLVQDCLERAWSRAHRWRPDSDLRAWLFTILHNLYVNAVRRGQRRPDRAPLPETCRDPGAEGQERAMRLRDVENGLAELAPEQREVLLLVCLEELSYREVADILGVPVGTVMSRLHRARERLRAYIQGGRGRH